MQPDTYDCCVREDMTSEAGNVFASSSRKAIWGRVLPIPGSTGVGTAGRRRQVLWGAQLAERTVIERRIMWQGELAALLLYSHSSAQRKQTSPTKDATHQVPCINN